MSQLVDSSYHQTNSRVSEKTELFLQKEVVMTSIALFGAGGKMGARLSKNLQGSPFEVRHVEVSEAGQKRLKDELGITCCSIDDALKGVDVVILGLLAPTSGAVLADGKSVHAALRGWQAQIGYVPQNIYLTDDTLRRNVAFGVPDDQAGAVMLAACIR